MIPFQGKPRLIDRARRPSRRAFRPSSEGMEPRLLLSAGIALPVLHAPVAAKLPKPKPQPPKADIVLENLSVTSLGNDQFRVTATLENGAPTLEKANVAHAGGAAASTARAGIKYPGGGVLQIVRSSGGTILNAQGTSPVATPDPGQVIASEAIPALGFHQSIQLSVVTQGRAIFTASAVAAVDSHGIPRKFPDANFANNSRTVDDLVPRTFTVNTFSLGLIPPVNNAVQNAQLKLDSNDSHIVIPGVIDQHFTIPTKTVSVGLLFGSISATYAVDNLVSTGAALSYEQGGLAVTVKFADNAHALHTDATLFPDIGVSNLQVKVFLPLSYDANLQFFHVGTPKVVVTGDFHAGGFAGDVIDLFLPDIGKKVSDALTAAIGARLDTLSVLLNQPIHDATKGGRIVSASVQPDQLVLSVETPA
jgi:hypothetical protein